MTDLPEQAALRDQCTVFLTGHGPVRPADLLASIPADTVPDRYGDGGVVAELEAEIAGLLGKPAAVYLPSGTMAQQSVLRVHADRRQRRAVVYHPLCHLDRHEDRAFQRLHGLTLRAQTEWASERGAAVHLDGRGARVAQADGRHAARTVAGGRLGAELPAAQAPADAGLPRPRPRDRVRPARAPGVRVVPDPPHVSMMHLMLAATQEGFAAAARRLAAEQGVWTWPQAMITPDPGVQRVELYVGDATRAVPPDKVRDIITALAAG